MIRVDTANRLQGAGFDVTIVLHPLSGRRDATAFHLEAGRLCVLASRHRHACSPMSDFGSGMGAAMLRQMTSETLILTLCRPLNWANTVT